MADREVSEKTLELNVAAEILDQVRSAPGGLGAFWIGMTQYREARNGLDVLLRNAPGARHLALQFKAPWPTAPDQEPYRYSINDRQHGHLDRLARLHPNAVHYVLPAFNTLRRLSKTAPHLRSHSWFLPVYGIGKLPNSTSGRHKVELFETSGRVLIRSDPIELEVSALTEILNRGPPAWQSQELVPHTALARWLDSVFEQEESGEAIGQRLRGFGTVCFP